VPTTLRRFVIAPSGFKESLSAELVADAIAAGVRRVVPSADVRSLPLVDGGEGSAATLAAATHGQLIPITVTGPVGDPVPAQIAVLGGAGPRTAVVEMAAAAGLRLVPRSLRNPGATTSYGVGELIMAAVEAGAERILVGCGDSGTCDGGAGALQALGARVRTTLGDDVGYGGAALAEVDSLDLTGLDPRLHGIEMLVAVNPHNVLCGPRGVARVFGPQKGATPEQVDTLSEAMDRWAKILERDTGLDLRTVAGSGASGGLGAGLAAGLSARLLPRFEVMFDHVDLDTALATADLVITAEGAIDDQTPRGKIPAEVARRAKRYGKPVIALAGTIGADARVNYDAGIDAYTGILPGPVDLEHALQHSAEYLTDATERTLRLILIGAALTAA
jgi:glycerate 2-kinase